MTLFHGSPQKGLTELRPDADGYLWSTPKIDIAFLYATIPLGNRHKGADPSNLGRFGAIYKFEAEFRKPYILTEITPDRWGLHCRIGDPRLGVKLPMAAAWWRERGFDALILINSDEYILFETIVPITTLPVDEAEYERVLAALPEAGLRRNLPR